MRHRVPRITGHHVGGWEWCGIRQLSPGIYQEHDAGTDTKGKMDIVKKMRILNSSVGV
jgi:hypothetical protein